SDANIPVLPDDYIPDVALARSSQDHFVNVSGRKLLDFCKLNGLRICNGRLGTDKGIGKYTYVGSSGSSVVDYVIVSESLLNNISQFCVCDPNILSDHCTLTFSLTSKQKHEQGDLNEKHYGQRIDKKYVWKPEETENYVSGLNFHKEELLNLQSNLREANTGNEIDENIGYFSNLMGKVCDPLFAKTIRTDKLNNYNKTKLQPWFDEDCKSGREIFYGELNNYRVNKSTQNQRKLVEARTNFKRIIRRKRFEYDKSKTDKLVVSQHKNVKEYWRMLKQMAHVENKSSVTSEKFAEYFQAINNPNDTFYQADDDILFFNERYIRGEFQVMFEELNAEISLFEIQKAVKQLKNGASGGPDLFLNEFFKNGSDTLLKYIHTLFNKLFEIGYFPDKWSDGFIVPIYKKGDKNEPVNYRGITLLSTIGKLSTRILNNRLND
ncbi:MAG: hypothetical protein AB2788_11585, partial [Candidatus Thiodiazotropha endolucinida]